MRLTSKSLATVVLAVSLAATAARADDQLTMGYLLSGPVGDVGWQRQLDEGRKFAEEKLGVRVKSVLVENVPEGPDVPRVINEMIANGAELIMLGTFGYMNDGLRIAEQNPNVKFLHASGFKQLPNFATFTTKTFQGAFIGGMAAGMVTKTDEIGIVAPFPIPEVIGIVNAFAIGARKTNPDANIKIVWVNTWYDPPKTGNAARALVSQEVDVLFSLYQNDPSVVNVAEESDLYSVATTDMSKYAPKKGLAMMDLKFGPLFVEVAESVLDGTFEGVDHWNGFPDGSIEMLSLSPDLTIEQRQSLDDAVTEITSGKEIIFAGPIKDQSGTVIVREGEIMDSAAIQSMNWLVEGVEGSLPQ